MAADDGHQERLKTQVEHVQLESLRQNPLLLSYVNLAVFLNLPEAQWMSIIDARHAAQTQAEAQPSLFNDGMGAVFENQKTMAYLQAISDEK